MSVRVAACAVGVVLELRRGRVRYSVSVNNSGGSPILQRTLTEFAGAGDCASVTADLAVNVIDLNQTATHIGYDGSATYDRLYDFMGAGIAGFSDGKITVIDLSQISARFGTCGPEL